MAKRYYWLKLQEDFFASPRIKKLRRIAGGDTFTIIYLKMQLLSVKTGGILTFQGVEETFEEELALILDEDSDNIKMTVAFLLAHGLMEQSDGCNFLLPEAAESIGSTSESRDRVRAYRERKAIRDSIPLVMVEKISKEQIRLPDGSIKFIDNKRYGGNAEYVYDLAECKCELCGESDSTKLVIHHNNGFSTDLNDLYLLCKSCHARVERGLLKCERHSRRSVTCNVDATESNTDIDRDIEIDKEKDTTLSTAAVVTTRAPARADCAATAAAVISMYKQKLGRAPSEDCDRELMQFLSTMDAACIERAINIAIDAGAPRWNYIKSILQDKQQKGVRHLADWDRLIANAAHQQPPPPQTGRRPPAGSAGTAPLGELERQALERMFSKPV